MPPKRTSRRLRGYPPKLQERIEVGNGDEEASPPQGASPPPGSARVDCCYSLNQLDTLDQQDLQYLETLRPLVAFISSGP